MQPNKMVYCRYAYHSPASGCRGCHRRYLLRQRRHSPSRATEAPRGWRKGGPSGGPLFLHFDVGGKVARGRRGGRLLLFRHGRSLNFLQYGPKRPKKILALILCFCATITTQARAAALLRAAARDRAIASASIQGFTGSDTRMLAYLQKEWGALFAWSLCSYRGLTNRRRDLHEYLER